MVLRRFYKFLFFVLLLRPLCSKGPEADSGCGGHQVGAEGPRRKTLAQSPSVQMIYQYILVWLLVKSFAKCNLCCDTKYKLSIIPVLTLNADILVGELWLITK